MPTVTCLLDILFSSAATPAPASTAARIATHCNAAWQQLLMGSSDIMETLYLADILEDGAVQPGDGGVGRQAQLCQHLHSQNYSVLYCTVLYSTVLYCTDLPALPQVSWLGI